MLQLYVVQFLTLLLQENVLFFVTLQLVPHTRCFFLAGKEVPYSNPTGMT
jgi:hypothetical protein